MSKHFRPWNIDQTLLLPPNVRDFVPKDHVSRFIVGLVRESLDLKAIMGSYVSGLGQPPFDPRMMVSLLLHGYASGLYSSRRIARACCERNDFVMIVALDPPDFRTISDFRKRPFEGARRVVPTGTEVVRDSRAGQTRPRRIGWHEDQSECVET
jgi:transposase